MKIYHDVSLSSFQFRVIEVTLNLYCYIAAQRWSVIVGLDTVHCACITAVLHSSPSHLATKRWSLCSPEIPGDYWDYTNK